MNVSQKQCIRFRFDSLMSVKNILKKTLSLDKRVKYRLYIHLLGKCVIKEKKGSQ